MLLITSGLLLHICVAAALIFPQRKTTDHKNMKNATKDSVNNIPDEDPKKKITDNDSASFRAITIDIVKTPSACIMFASTFFFYVGLSVVYTLSVIIDSLHPANEQVDSSV